MWIHNTYLYVSGDIVYENTQKAVSGLKSYESPSEVTGSAWFAALGTKKRDVKDKYTSRRKQLILTTQFGWGEIKRLQESGIMIEPEATKMDYNGDRWRVIDVEEFQKYNHNFLPIGIYEVEWRRIFPNANR